MGLYDVVRFEPNTIDWVLYKYNNDEIFVNSKLIVGPGQVAIIVHNGKIEKIFESGSTKLSTENLPILTKLIKKLHFGKLPFPMEVYFINERVKLDFLWGTSSPIELIDPKFNIKLRLLSRGQLGLKIDEYQYMFETLIGTIDKNSLVDYSLLSSFFKGVINQKMRKIISSIIIKEGISYFDISPQLDTIQEIAEKEIGNELKKMGFRAMNFSIESIECPPEDTEKLNSILHKKAEFTQMGDERYRVARGYDVLEAGAKAGGTAASIMGVGLGVNLGKEMTGGGIIPSQGKSAKFKCPKCGEELPMNSKFCPECGTKIITQCPKCKHEIDKGIKFCPECGKKLYK